MTTLLDGRHAELRPGAPTDAGPMARFMERLLSSSVHAQHAGILFGGTSERRARLLTPGPSHHAVVACPADDPHTVVGVAAYDLVPEEQSCLVALLVDPRWEGVRLGSALLAALIVDGRARGFRHFHTEMLGGNIRMMHLLRDLLGNDARTTPRGGHMRVDFSVA